MSLFLLGLLSGAALATAVEHVMSSHLERVQLEAKGRWLAARFDKEGS